MTPRTAEQRIQLALDTDVMIYYSKKAATRTFDAYTFQLKDEAAPTTVRVHPAAKNSDALQRVCVL